MAKLNAHRALVAISDGIGNFAQLSYQQERDRVMAQREENMLRLHATLNETARTNERTFQAGEAEKDRTARAESERLAREQSATQHSESLRVQREGLDIQRDQLDQQRLTNLDKGYMAQLEAVDDELSQINGYLTEARAEGKVVDESALKPYQERLTALQQQRTSLMQERAFTLARSGDSRYVKLSPEQVEQLRKEGKIPGGPQTAAQGPKPNAQPPRTAAAADMPPPPEKPPGMKAREERKQQRTLVPNAGKGDRGDIAGAGTAFKGARQARDLVTGISASIEGRKNEGTVIRAFKSGGDLSPEQRQQLRAIGRGRLKGVYKLSDEDLAKIF